jgi:hypothetical protein
MACEVHLGGHTPNRDTVEIVISTSSCLFVYVDNEEDGMGLPKYLINCPKSIWLLWPLWVDQLVSMLERLLQVLNLEQQM